LIFIGLILGIIENRANFYLQRVFGRKGIMVTAWIGAPIHELGHLLMCYLFGHKVTEFKLFDFRVRNGILGYVKHRWNSKNLYQNIGNFFIGMGPLLSGTAALILGIYLLLPDSFATFANYLSFEPDQPEPYILVNIPSMLTELFVNIFSLENATSPRFWIYVLLAFGVSSHIALSRDDLKEVRRGLITIFVSILLINIIAFIIGLDFSGIFAIILTLNIYFLAFSMVSIFFSLIRLFLSAFLYFLAYRTL
jgi:hypothetical protein